MWGAVRWSGTAWWSLLHVASLSQELRFGCCSLIQHLLLLLQLLLMLDQRTSGVRGLLRTRSLLLLVSLS